MLCWALLRPVTHYFTLLCYALLCSAALIFHFMLCYALLWAATFCNALLYSLCYSLLCCASPFFAISSAMFCYALLGRAMLYNALL